MVYLVSLVSKNQKYRYFPGIMHQFISGNIVDLFNKTIFKGTIVWENGRITEARKEENVPDQYILPGFTDAHIHIESSMLTPYEFARMALTHGTIATVSDPHEIANVCGLNGVYYMLEDAEDACRCGRLDRDWSLLTALRHDGGASGGVPARSGG